MTHIVRLLSVLRALAMCFSEVAFRAFRDNLPPLVAHSTDSVVVTKPLRQPTSNGDHNSGAVTRGSSGSFFSQPADPTVAVFLRLRSKCNLSDVIDFLFKTRISNEVYKNPQTQNNIISCNFSCANLSSQPICSNMELDR